MPSSPTSTPSFSTTNPLQLTSTSSNGVLLNYSEVIAVSVIATVAAILFAIAVFAYIMTFRKSKKCKKSRVGSSALDLEMDSDMAKSYDYYVSRTKQTDFLMKWVDDLSTDHVSASPQTLNINHNFKVITTENSSYDFSQDIENPMCSIEMGLQSDASTDPRPSVSTNASATASSNRSATVSSSLQHGDSDFVGTVPMMEELVVTVNEFSETESERRKYQNSQRYSHRDLNKDRSSHVETKAGKAIACSAGDDDEQHYSRIRLSAKHGSNSNMMLSYSDVFTSQRDTIRVTNPTRPHSSIFFR